MMRDLERAKRMLKEDRLSLVIVKNGEAIFSSDSSGINSILQAIDNLGDRLSRASAADKIVGKAAALLFAYSHIKEAYAVTLSTEGLSTLRKNRIFVEYEKLVPRILDKNRRDICPFEKLVLEIESPSQAYKELKRFMKEIMRKSG
ncbi:hypothetical protein DRO35_02570 [Candidatus Bathyarchaeota archaeon]|nr:MAG: hypothetical protein DRO35_02570 [Candidatus Bathyarchaeota archaeon]